MNLYWIWSKCKRVFSPEREDVELREEIRAHLEMAEADLRSQGMDAAEARREARIRFGGVTQATENAREQRDVAWLQGTVADLRFAVRQIVRNPGFFLICVLTLGVGIGATAAIYSFVDSILLHPLPFPESERLVHISGFYPKGWVRAVQQNARTLDGVMGYSLPREHNIAVGHDPERAFVSETTVNVLEVLGERAELGRGFLPAEEIAGQDHVVLLSDGFWRERFGADPGVIGRSLRVDGEARTIVGVLPRGLNFPNAQARLLLPLSFRTGDPIDPWAMFTLQMIGRERAERTPAESTAELRTLHPQLLQMFPWPMPTRWNADVVATPLLEFVVQDARLKLEILFAAVVLLLLIACANVANLMLSRASVREAEMAMRAALGASRRRLLRQVLTESLLLGLLAGFVGLAFGSGVVHVLKSLLPAETPRLAEIGIHGSLAASGFVLAVTTSLLCGLASAFRVNGMAPRAALQAGSSQQGGSRERFRLSSMLAVGQITMAVVVVLAAGLLLHSLWQLVHVDPGFRRENTVTARISLDTESCASAAEVCRSYFGNLLQRVRALPGVSGASLTSMLPMLGTDDGFAFDVEGRPREGSQTPDQGSNRTVSPSYFSMMGIGLLRGRLLEEQDASGTTGAVLINKTFADHAFPGGNPIGRRLEWVGQEKQQGVLDDSAFTIVGVVADTRHQALDAAPGLEMYTPYTPVTAKLAAPEMSLLIRSRTAPETISQEVRSLTQAMGTPVAVSDVQTLETLVQSTAESQRSLTILLCGFAVLALCVSLIGVYSLLAYRVTSRRRELAIRIALGASRARVMRQVLREALLIAATGCFAGAVAAALLARVLRAYLFATGSLQPEVYAGVLVLMTVATLAAVWQPALQAAKAEPVSVLRSQ